MTDVKYARSPEDLATACQSHGYAMRQLQAEQNENQKSEINMGRRFMIGALYGVVAIVVVLFAINGPSVFALEGLIGLAMVFPFFGFAGGMIAVGPYLKKGEPQLPLEDGSFIATKHASHDKAREDLEHLHQAAVSNEMEIGRQNERNMYFDSH